MMNEPIIDVIGATAAVVVTSSSSESSSPPLVDDRYEQIRVIESHIDQWLSTDQTYVSPTTFDSKVYRASPCVNIKMHINNTTAVEQNLEVVWNDDYVDDGSSSSRTWSLPPHTDTSLYFNIADDSISTCRAGVDMRRDVSRSLVTRIMEYGFNVTRVDVIYAVLKKGKPDNAINLAQLDAALKLFEITMPVFDEDEIENEVWRGRSSYRQLV